MNNKKKNLFFCMLILLLGARIFAGTSALAQAPQAPSVNLEFVPFEGGIKVLSVSSGSSKSQVGMIPLTGAIHQILVDGATLYVARGTEGLGVYDVSNPSSPVEIATLEKGKDVVGVKKIDGALMVIVSSYEVSIVDVSDPKFPHPAGAGALLGKEQAAAQAAAGAGAAAAPAAAKQGPGEAAPKEKEGLKKITGKVTKVKADWVILDIGSDDGVAQDMRFAVLSQELVKKLDLTTGGYTKVPSGEKTAVLVIEQVTKSQSGGRLKRGESALPGDFVSLTDEVPRISLMAPKGQFGFSQMQIVLRPFFGVGKLSFGMLSDLMISHQFRVPLRIGFYLWPLGFATGGAGTGAPNSLMGIVTYSSSYFEIGLGLGGAFSLNRTKAGLTINQFIRMGSLEGFHVLASTSFVLQKTGDGSGSDGEYEVAFGQAGGEINIPLHKRITLSLTGGGGLNGWAFGTLGIKTYVRGNGGKGTIIIPAALGYSVVFDEECTYDPITYHDICSGITSHGPTFSIGIDYRF